MTAARFNPKNVTVMKQLGQLALAALLVFGFCLASFAQETGTINASADVLATLAFNNSSGLDFGNISSGQGETVNLDDANAGFIELDADDADVDLDIDWPQTNADENGLTKGDTEGDDDLPVSFTYSTNSDETANSPDGTGGASLSSEESASAGSDDISFNPFDGSAGGDSKTIGIWIGGTIDGSDTGTQGAYDGTITLTATYN